MNDKVKKPNHYTNGNKEVRVAIEDNFSVEETVGYYKGNIIKYVCRYEFKNGIEDIRKAQTYVEFLMELYCHVNEEEFILTKKEIAFLEEIMRAPKDFVNNKEYMSYLKAGVVGEVVLIDDIFCEDDGKLIYCLKILLDEMEEVLIEEECGESCGNEKDVCENISHFLNSLGL